MTRQKKPPYYQVRNGRAFFELGKKRAEKVGMSASTPLGRDGVTAKKQASELYYEWREKSGFEVPKKAITYERGTLGHWYSIYRKKDSFTKKKPATIRHWDFYWPFIDKELGHKGLGKITPSEFEAFYLKIEAERGIDERWRIVKLARALFNAAKKYHLITRSPCMTLPNTKPPARHQIWLAHEVEHMIAVATTERPVMALAIRLSWETLMSPVDVRTLPMKALRRDPDGFHLETARAKTAKPVFSAISDLLGSDLLEYIDALPFTLLPDQPILRTTRDSAAYTRARFNSDFALIRKLAFGPDEKRWMMDLRRSGNVEADLGGASPDDRAEMLANALNTNKELDKTYTPLTIAKARNIAKQRIIGREVLSSASPKDARQGLNND